MAHPSGPASSQMAPGGAAPPRPCHHAAGCRRLGACAPQAQALPCLPGHTLVSRQARGRQGTARRVCTAPGRRHVLSTMHPSTVSNCWHAPPPWGDHALQAPISAWDHHLPAEHQGVAPPPHLSSRCSTCPFAPPLYAQCPGPLAVPPAAGHPSWCTRTRTTWWSASPRACPAWATRATARSTWRPAWLRAWAAARCRCATGWTSGPQVCVCGGGLLVRWPAGAGCVPIMARHC
jgi:hypothetical protein